jgi:hypothetical protein
MLWAGRFQELSSRVSVSGRLLNGALSRWTATSRQQLHAVLPVPFLVLDEGGWSDILRPTPLLTWNHSCGFCLFLFALDAELLSPLIRPYHKV